MPQLSVHILFAESAALPVASAASSAGTPSAPASADVAELVSAPSACGPA